MKALATEITIHVKIPGGWYEGLRRLASEVEGSVHQQARLAIRERLERTGADFFAGNSMNQKMEN